jgi:hypothetical protein
MLCYACGGDIRHGLCVNEMKAIARRGNPAGFKYERLSFESGIRLTITNQIRIYHPRSRFLELLFHRIRAEGLDWSSSQVAIRT